MVVLFNSDLPTSHHKNKSAMQFNKSELDSNYYNYLASATASK